MPAYGMIFIFDSGSYLSLIPLNGKIFLISIVLLGTLILPLSFIPVLNYLKIVNNIEMEKTSERVFPLLLTSIFFFLTYYLLRRFPIPLINSFILASTLCVFINFLINLKWKVSSHLIGVGGFTGLVSVVSIRIHSDVFLYLILAIAISGLAGFARLRLDKHTPAQVYTGFLLGYCTMLAINFL